MDLHLRPVHAGTGENFFPAPGLLPFLANAKRMNFGLTLRPSARFRFDETLIYIDWERRAGSVPPPSSAGAKCFQQLPESREMNYQLHKRTVSAADSRLQRDHRQTPSFSMCKRSLGVR